jgi:hypothetical protein
MQTSGGSVRYDVEVKPRESMRLCVAILKLGGLWHTRDMTHRGAILYNVFKTFTVLVFSAVSSSLYIYLFVAWTSFIDMLETVAYCISMIVYALKFYVILFRHDEVQHITNTVQENFIIHGSELSTENRNIIKNTVKSARRVTIAYATMNISSLIIYTILGPLISAKVPFHTQNATNISSESHVSNRKLPFETWFPVDVTHSPRFEIAYMYLSITAVVNTCNFVGIEVFLMTTFIYITGQFELLCDSIRNASERVTYRLNQRQLASADSDDINESNEFTSDKQKKIGFSDGNTESSIIPAMGKETITYGICRGADNSLVFLISYFPICSTNKRIFLG